MAIPDNKDPQTSTTSNAYEHVITELESVGISAEDIQSIKDIQPVSPTDSPTFDNLTITNALSVATDITATTVTVSGAAGACYLWHNDNNGHGWYSDSEAANNRAGIYPNSGTEFYLLNSQGKYNLIITATSGKMWFGNVATYGAVEFSDHQYTFDGTACFLDTMCAETNDNSIFSVAELTNTYNNASMTNVGASVALFQYYYDITTPAAVQSGSFDVFTEGNWTSTASTQDAGWRIRTALNGVQTTQLSGDSAGNVVATGKLTSSILLYGSASTRADVRADGGDSAPIGAQYNSSAGKMYLKVANAAADTDWQRVTTTAVD